jgi:predicted DsbA family dithiol-disulfide isomerase
MKPPALPLQITVYQDVLCSWCYLADLRFEVLRHELQGVVQWRARPYPLRIVDALPTPKERNALLEEVQRARAEADPAARLLSTELWSSDDAPRSSVPALAALEAARLQGAAARTALYRTMQRAALEQGVNVTRTDVIFELASRVGLKMNAFAAAFGSAQTRELVMEEHRAAASRGVKGVPTIVIGGRWMVCGLREVSEYREHILACLGKVYAAPTRPGFAPERTVH